MATDNENIVSEGRFEAREANRLQPQKSPISSENSKLVLDSK